MPAEPADFTEWRWYNEHRLYAALDACDPDERDDVLDGLDSILAEPDGPLTTFMEGTRDHVDRRIALLPHGWVLIYTPYPGGVPPSATPGILVRELRRMFSDPSEP